MSLRLFRHDDPEHLEAFELLPWLASNTLETTERARVERHVSECIACRRELDLLHEMKEAIRNEDADAAYKPGLARVLARIDQKGPGSASLLSRLLTALHPAPAVLRTVPWVFAAGLIAALWLVRSTPPAQVYHVLASPSANVQRAGTQSDIVVVFRPGQSEQHMRALLLELNARISDGPSAEGAYVITLSSHPKEALMRLRADNTVAFAEPLPKSGIVR